MSYRKLLRIYGIFCVFGVFIISYASAETQKKYIVVFKDHPKKREMLKKPKFTSAKSFNIIPAMATELDSENLKELQKDQDVAYIEQDYPVYATDITTAGEESVSIAAETSSQDIPYGVELIGATQVWSKTKGAGAIVAILDTGISMYHPDRGNVIASSSFVTNETVEDLDGHGTHTSGTIAAADNNLGVIGVAPEADLLIGKVLDNNGSGYTSWVISGIEWAVENGANVISMSLSGTDYSASLETACNNAFSAGTLVVAAAGNDNTDVLNYPAAYASVLSVAAVDQNKLKASFSNYGSTIDLAAPGVEVLSTVSAGNDVTGDARWSSTSHSSNVVAGTASGTISGQICNCGLATGLDADNTCPDSVAGNIAHIRRGSITFAEKVAHAKSKGAIGVIISNNASGNFLGTLNGVGSTLVIVSISQADGSNLELLAENGISGSVSVTLSTTTDIYEYYSGTSMATPHVAGAAALIFAAQDGAVSATEVWNILINSAEDLGTQGRDNIFGYGLVDVSSAFETMAPRTCNAAWTLGYGHLSDIDMDCYLGSNDLYLFATEWLNSNCSSLNEWCNKADIDQSSSVSLSDFAELASLWLTCNDPENTNCTPNWP